MNDLLRSRLATHPRHWGAAALAGMLMLSAFAAWPGCRALRQAANLRQVDFAIDDVERAQLAGVSLDEVRNPNDVRIGDFARLGTALAQGELPMEFTLMLGAENPAENGQTARLMGMDWTLLLEDQETISGTFDKNVRLPAGQTKTVPVEMRLDLLEFFDRGGRDLLELALSVAGVGGEPTGVSLRARPRIDTPVGPIEYPRPITIDVGEVGDGELVGTAREEVGKKR